MKQKQLKRDNFEIEHCHRSVTWDPHYKLTKILDEQFELTFLVNGFPKSPVKLVKVREIATGDVYEHGGYNVNLKGLINVCKGHYVLKCIGELHKLERAFGSEFKEVATNIPNAVIITGEKPDKIHSGLKRVKPAMKPERIAYYKKVLATTKGRRSENNIAFFKVFGL